MNKEIETMAKDVCHAFDGHDDYEVCGDCFGGKDKYYGCKSFAEKLYNAGYRKIVWHNVADGDLPVSGQTVIAYDGFDTFVAYTNYKKEWYFVTSNTPACGIIAWMELPKYEEE